jgi:hypothetical protein
LFSQKWIEFLRWQTHINTCLSPLLASFNFFGHVRHFWNFVLAYLIEMSCKPMHKLYHLLYHIGMFLTWHAQNMCLEKTPPIRSFHMSFDNNFQSYYHCSQVCTLIFDVSKHFFSISKFFKQCKWSFSVMDGPFVFFSFFKQPYCNMFWLPICKNDIDNNNKMFSLPTSIIPRQVKHINSFIFQQTWVGHFFWRFFLKENHLWTQL